MTTEQPLHSDTDALGRPLGRPTGFALDEVYAVAYAYVMFGRFQCVLSSVLPPVDPCSLRECCESGKQEIRKGTLARFPDFLISILFWLRQRRAVSAGRVTFRQTSSGGLSQSTTNAYDLAGRLVWSRGPDGVESLYSYGSNSTTTVRGGLTNLSVRFADGRSRYTEQNGVRQTTHAYGVNSDGTQWSTVFTGPDGTNSAAWSKTVTDPLGRTVAQIRPGFGGGLLITSNAYNTAGQLIKTQVSSFEFPVSQTLHTYDDLGEPLLTCEDLDLDGVIDLSGPDRVSGRSSRYVQISGDWWHESASWTYAGDGSSTPLTNAVNRTKRSLHHLARRGVLKKFKMPGFSRACGIRESDLNALLQGAA